MKKCKYCQSEIDQKAKVCPKCGKKQGNFFQKHPVLTVFLVLILFGMIFGGNSDDSKDSKNTNTDSSSSKNKITTTVTTRNPEEVKNEFIAQCQTIGYKDVARNPDNYKGVKAKFTGKVVQVQEGMFNTIVMRVNVTKGSYGIWEDTVYANYTYSEGESKILEDDIITMYGTIKGTKTYTTVLGSSVTIPQLDVKYIELN